MADQAATYEALAQIWAQVLGVESVSPDADFWALGGDSLAAIQVAALSREALGRPEEDEEVLLFALFDEPTLTDYARVAAAGQEATQPV